MSTPRSPLPVKLIASILTGEQALVASVRGELEQRFGAVDFCSDALSFHYTDYYTAELGRNLVRHVLSFSKLIEPDMLPAVKLATNGIEQLFLKKSSARRVNIDPGYVALPHVVLATFKPFSHRTYLAQGVYADLTLMYRDKTYSSLEWTFPDYRSPDLVTMLNTIRAVYFRQLKDAGRL